MTSFHIDGGATLSCKIYDSFALQPDEETTARLCAIDKQTRRLSRLLKLDEPDVADCLDDMNLEFLPRFVHHSAAIEGSTLTLADTQTCIRGRVYPQRLKRIG